MVPTPQAWTGWGSFGGASAGICWRGDARTSPPSFGRGRPPNWKRWRSSGVSTNAGVSSVQVRQVCGDRTTSLRREEAAWPFICRRLECVIRSLKMFAWCCKPKRRGNLLHELCRYPVGSWAVSTPSGSTHASIDNIHWKRYGVQASSHVARSRHPSNGDQANIQRVGVLFLAISSECRLRHAYPLRFNPCHCSPS